MLFAETAASKTRAAIDVLSEVMNKTKNKRSSSLKKYFKSPSGQIVYLSLVYLVVAMAVFVFIPILFFLITSIFEIVQ